MKNDILIDLYVLYESLVVKSLLLSFLNIIRYINSYFFNCLLLRKTLSLFRVLEVSLIILELRVSERLINFSIDRDF